MAGTSVVEIVVEKTQRGTAVRLSRLRVSCRPRQEHPFRELDRLIWGARWFSGSSKFQSTADRYVTWQREFTIFLHVLS